MDDVAFFDLQYHAVAVQRRNLEQHFALLYRRSKQLLQVSRNDEPVKWRHDGCARKLAGNQGQGGINLTDLGTKDDHRGALLGGKCLPMLTKQLLAFRLEPGLLELQVLVIQTAQNLAC